MQIFDGLKLPSISATTKSAPFLSKLLFARELEKFEVWPFFGIIFTHRDGTIFHFQLTVALATAVASCSYTFKIGAYSPQPRLDAIK